MLQSARHEVTPWIKNRTSMNIGQLGEEDTSFTEKTEQNDWRRSLQRAKKDGLYMPISRNGSYALT